VIIAIIGNNSVEKTKQEIYAKVKNNLANLYNEKIEEKKSVGITNAIALANDSVIKKALILFDREMAIKEVESLQKMYRKYTKFKNIKIHIHTQDLFSFVRSWNLEKWGDYLGNFRKSLVWVKKHETPLVTFEVGRAGLLLRGIAPVFDSEKEYIGSVEFIQGLNSVSKELLKQNVYVLITMKSEYLSIAEFLHQNSKGFVVSLKKGAYDPIYYEAIKNNYFQLKTHDQIVSNGFFIIKLPIYDFNKNVVGYAFVAEKSSEIERIIERNLAEIKKILAIMFVIDLILMFIIYFIIKRAIIKPLYQIKDGLEAFFDYLQHPEKRIKPINIKTGDEFEEIANFINHGIMVSAKLHNERFELMRIIDESVIIVNINENAEIIDVTSKFCEVSGYKKQEIIGKDFLELIEDDKDKELIKEAIQKERPLSKEIKLKGKNSLIWLDIILTRQCIGDDECRFVIIGYDIRDKKLVEELSKNLEKKVEERTKSLLEAKEEIEQLHQKTKESIEFASMIQKALLAEETCLIKSCFKDGFIIWMPRDIVGGDIYLFEKFNENECLLMVIDCTSHGVPGAFVTMIVKAIEREIVSKIREEKMEVSPSWILQHFNRVIKKLLNQFDKDADTNVGFDGGVVYYNKFDQILKFAGANTSLFFKHEELKEYKGDRQSVGYKVTAIDYVYNEIVLNVEEGDRFYLTTDGFLDQLGGSKGYPFGKKRFKKIISTNLPLKDQKEMLLNELKEYAKGYEQTDDITVIGAEVGDKSSVEVLLDYEGEFTQGLISHFMDLIEEKLDLNKMAKVATIVAEIAQNILKYAKDKNSNFMPFGNLKIIKSGDYVIVQSKNIVNSKDKEVIQKTLEEIKHMDKKAIRKKYRELRKQTTLSSQGAGIGFYEVAKLASELDYRFEKIAENAYNFVLTIKV